MAASIPPLKSNWCFRAPSATYEDILSEASKRCRFKNVPTDCPPELTNCKSEPIDSDSLTLAETSVEEEKNNEVHLQIVPFASCSSKTASCNVDRSRKKLGLQFLNRLDDSEKGLARFRRVWGESDEMVILKGIVDYKAEMKSNPLENIGAFHDFIKKDLQVKNASDTQLRGKIGKIKGKFLKSKSQNRSFSDEVFELCWKIWGRRRMDVGRKVVWSEADDILILKAMIDYAAMKKPITVNKINDFLNFAQERLNLGASKEYLHCKIIMLKRKYKNSMITNENLAEEVFELCQKVWGNKVTKKNPPTDNGNAVYNMDVTDGALEKMVNSSGVNMEEKVLIIGSELFEGENKMEGAKKWKELLLDELKLNLAVMDVEESRLCLKRKEMDLEEMKLRLKSSRAKLVVDCLENH